MALLDCVKHVLPVSFAVIIVVIVLHIFSIIV